MSDSRSLTPQSYRALKAVALVLALLLSVPGVEALVSVAGEKAVADPVANGVDSAQLVCVGDPDTTLERIEEAVAAQNTEVPGPFAQEVGFLPGASDIRVDQSGAIVGYVVSGDAAKACENLVEHMESLGWNSVSLGGVDGATFSKSGGACTWVLATCTQVGSDTSVVMRCMYS